MMDFWPSRQSAIHQVLVSVHFAFQKSDPIVLSNINGFFNCSSIEQAAQRLRQFLRQRAGPGQQRPWTTPPLTAPLRRRVSSSTPEIDNHPHHPICIAEFRRNLRARHKKRRGLRIPRTGNRIRLMVPRTHCCGCPLRRVGG